MTHKHKTPVTLAQLEELLNYEPETGLLRWKVKRGNGVGTARSSIGDVAGTLNAHIGYLVINIDGTAYGAHRMAWALFHGVWPFSHQIDHINRNKADNRIANLRAATNSTNKYNIPARSHNRLGIKGVCLTPNGTYSARTKVDGKTINIGNFPTAEEARAAYNAVASVLHGEFFRES